MRQYRITGFPVDTSTDPDCALSPDDPIHALQSSNWLGELGADRRMQEYLTKREMPAYGNVGNENAKIMREQGIKPGTPAWFELWYGGRNK
jgi:hypothetical protein